MHEAFAGVDHILHAGDVGSIDVITELEAIAPVSAVIGNTDYGIQLPETRLEEFWGEKIMIHHIVDVDFPSQHVRTILNSDQPDIVVFGHTHVPFEERRDRVWYINPGSASRPRDNSSASVAILDFSEHIPKLQHRTLVD